VGDRAASEVTAEVDGKTEVAVPIYERRAERIVRAVDYCPVPYPASAWRVPCAKDMYADDR
jgi:hypothetical protein